MYDPAILFQFAITGLALGSIYALVAIGFAMIFNASGILNFAQGAFVMVGGMLTYVLVGRGGLFLGIGILLAIIAAGIIGLATERLTIRPLWVRNAPLYAMMMALFGVQIVLENGALLLVGSQAYGYPAFSSGGPLTLFGSAISYQILWIFAVTALLMLGLNLLFRRTMLGKAMRASAVNREAAMLMGVDVNRMLTYAFIGSALLGAIGGALIAPQQFTAFNVGLPYALKGFAAAILGGFGNLTGAVVGGLLLGIIEALAIGFISSKFSDVIIFTLLIVLLLVRPSGLFGSLVEEDVV